MRLKVIVLSEDVKTDSEIGHPNMFYITCTYNFQRYQTVQTDSRLILNVSTIKPTLASLMRLSLIINAHTFLYNYLLTVINQICLIALIRNSTTLQSEVAIPFTTSRCL